MEHELREPAMGQFFRSVHRAGPTVLWFDAGSRSPVLYRFDIPPGSECDNTNFCCRIDNDQMVKWSVAALIGRFVAAEILA